MFFIQRKMNLKRKQTRIQILLCGNPSMMFRTATKDHLFFSRLSSIVFIRVWIPLLVGPCDSSRHLSTTTLRNFAHFLCYLLQWCLGLCQVSCQIPLVRSWTGEMPMVTWIGAPAPACVVWSSPGWHRLEYGMLRNTNSSWITEHRCNNWVVKVCGYSL